MSRGLRRHCERSNPERRLDCFVATLLAMTTASLALHFRSRCRGVILKLQRQRDPAIAAGAANIKHDVAAALVAELSEPLRKIRNIIELRSLCVDKDIADLHPRAFRGGIV